MFCTHYLILFNLLASHMEKSDPKDFMEQLRRGFDSTPKAGSDR